MKLPISVDLTGKTAIVTGAGGVLCSVMSEALASCGAAVAVADIRAEAAEAVAEKITAAGGRAIAVAADVLNRESLEAAYARVRAELGPCDILINGAGGNHPRGNTASETFSPSDLDTEGLATFFNLEPQNIAFVFNLNFLGTLLPTQAFARDMAAGRGGNIINMSSMAAFRPLTKVVAYGGAKAAVSNFTQWLAVHFAPSGIRVNAIAPGFFATAQNHDLLYNKDGSLTVRSEKIIAHTPQRRFGVPEDLLGTLLWLLCEEASGFVNGAVIPVDGGFAAYSGV